MLNLPGLSQEATPAEKAAYIAEAVISNLPDTTALAARRCVILHWFDQLVVAALSPEASAEQATSIFEELTALPFIEPVPGGFAYHALTREGLLNRYAAEQADILITASKLAIPAYATRTDDKQAIAEAFFCTIIVGEIESAAKVLDDAYKTLSARGDWTAISYWFSLQDEAESLSIVKPLPRSFLNWLTRAATHYFSRDMVTALADLAHAIELNPDDSFAYYLRGNTHHAQKEYPAALADYTQAIKLAPNDVQAYNDRGLVYHEIAEYKKALVDYTHAIELNPNFALSFYNRGITYSKQKDYRTAVADYSRAIELNPQLAQAYNNRGNAFAMLKDYERALADFNRSLELDPGLAQAYYNRGLTYNNLTSYPSALADYTRALELDPNYLGVYLNRGAVYAVVGDYEAALSDYAHALELDPNYVGAIYNTACTYALLNDTKQSCTWLRKAIAMDDKYVGMAQTDSDFDAIRDTPEFKALLQDFAPHA